MEFYAHTEGVDQNSGQNPSVEETVFHQCLHSFLEVFLTSCKHATN